MSGPAHSCTTPIPTAAAARRKASWAAARVAGSTLMVNPPYGERIEVAGKAARAAARRTGERPRRAERFLRPPRRALEARLHRAPGGMDGLDPEPRPEAARCDAAEGIAPRSDVERADRVPPVPLRSGRRIGATPRPPNRLTGVSSARPRFIADASAARSRAGRARPARRAAPCRRAARAGRGRPATKPRASAALSSAGARPPSGPLRTTSSRPRTAPRRIVARAPARRASADGARLSTMRMPRRRGRRASRARRRSDATGRTRRRGRGRIARSPPPPPPASGARCASARSPERRTTDRSQTSGWIAAAPSSPAFSTSASMRSLAGTPSASVTVARELARRPAAARRGGRRRALRPMRTISAGHSAPSLPLKSDERVAGLQAQHLDVPRRGRRQRDDARRSRRPGARRCEAAGSVLCKASSRFSPRRATRRMRARRCARRPIVAMLAMTRSRVRAPPAPRSGRTRRRSSAATRPGRRGGRRTPCRCTLAATMRAMPSVACPSWISQSAASLTGKSSSGRDRERAAARRSARRAPDARLERGERRPARDRARQRGERPPAPLLDEDDERRGARAGRSGAGRHSSAASLRTDGARRRRARCRDQPP